MNARDFYEIWLQSALNERAEARRLRRMSDDLAQWMADKAMKRAAYDLAQARRFKEKPHANR